MKRLAALAGLVVFAGSVGAATLPPAPSFSRASSYATGHYPYSVALGDLNGDSKPDLATANGLDSKTVSVLINRGNGSFRVKHEFGTGRGPESVAIGDLNVDGKADLATANQAANTVSVLLNKGDGTFLAKRDYPAGLGTISVAIADLNGDDKPDLVTANEDDVKEVSVLLNGGDGTFQAKRDFGPGSAIDVSIGDLNGDGSRDLAIVNKEYGITVLLNAGDGSFPVRRGYGALPDAYSIAIGDLNGDGEPDLVNTNSDQEEGPSVSVLLNRGGGSFRSGVYYRLAGDWRTGGGSVAIGDLNGDRKPDLAVTTRLEAVSVLVNKGNGSFQPQLDYRIGHAPVSVGVGDLNGDRKPDLATANLGGTVSVLINRPGLCTVQKVKGEPLPVAKHTLARANCRVGKVSRAYSQRVKGHVILQKPGFGTVLPNGGKVNLVISRGRRPS